MHPGSLGTPFEPTCCKLSSMNLNVLLGIAGFCFFAYLFWGHNRVLSYLLLGLAFGLPILGRIMG